MVPRLSHERDIDVGQYELERGVDVGWYEVERVDVGWYEVEREVDATPCQPCVCFR
jgi:hypothetical protein